MYLIFECSNTFMLATVQHSIVTVMQKLTMIGSSPFSRFAGSKLILGIGIFLPFIHCSAVNSVL
jgi:hypothetical protein